MAKMRFLGKGISFFFGSLRDRSRVLYDLEAVETRGNVLLVGFESCQKELDRSLSLISGCRLPPSGSFDRTVERPKLNYSI
ncbi:hypothetical protein VNO77_04898 [Canavalia gladiata]|uniref:Uncharacterized protein n=1 Tax=Canavalia gladiata TaxID=3824 RepID=A0AAN9R866_CANGL